MQPVAQIVPYAEEPRDLLPLAHLFESEMKKYPPGFLNGRLDRVNLVRDLNVITHRAGGFFNPLFPSEITIARGQPGSIFHHELAHLLWSQSGTSEFEERWKQALPKGFSYPLFLGLLSDKKGRYSGSGRDGFVSEYAERNFHEDFAETAEHLFDPNGWIWIHAKRDPTIQRKLDLMIEFYGSLDPRFTRTYFRRLESAE